MELKATTLGKRLAQHPYDRAVILNAGIKVSGDRHEYLILSINYWRFTVSAVWYGASWNLYCRTKKWCVCTAPNGARRSVFTIILMLTGGGGVAMSEIASGVLRQQLDLIATRTGENKWLTREQTSGVQQQIRQALSALPLPVNRLEELITAVRRGVNVRPG